MTDLKFALLEKLYHTAPTHPLSDIDLLNSHFDAYTRIDAAVEDLKEQGYVVGRIGSRSLSLTSAGRIAYETAKEEREKQAKNERQQRFDNKISVASVLIPCITFVLGLIIEHFSGIVEWIISLFP